MYFLILRLLHIAAGVFWAGVIFKQVVFILPTVAKLGPDGGKFMQAMVNTNNYTKVMITSAVTTILTGILMMERLSSGFQPDWFGSTFGISLSIGSTFAIFAFIIGISINMPTAGKMAKLGQQIAAAGVPPTDEQQAQLAGFRQKIKVATYSMGVLLALAVVLMAVARYMGTIM
jgi:uncharacterized membrane protein